MLLLVIGCAAAAPFEAGLLREGDVVLHQSRSAQSAALRAATGSPYTHVGLVFRRDGGWAVLEAVQPVRWTSLADWRGRGAGGHIVVVRADVPLSEAELGTLRTTAEGYLGRSYDRLFEWSDDRIYCSELVYKAYAAAGRALGDLVPLAQFDLSAAPVRQLVRERVQHALNLEEPVVAPASMLDHDGFHVVQSTDPSIPASAP